MLLLYFLAAGLLLGRLSGGRLSHLGTVQFQWAGLALCGLLAQLALFAPPVASRVGDLGPALYVASTMAVLAALLRNVRLPGLAIVAVGAFSNLVAIVVNGGFMPSAPAAWMGLNGVAALPTTDYSNSAIAGPGTLFPFLGDVFFLPRPIPLANVFSIGDVLIGVGAAWFLVRALHGLQMPGTHAAEGPANAAAADPGTSAALGTSAAQATGAPGAVRPPGSRWAHHP